MTNKAYTSDATTPLYDGYKRLAAYQMAEIVYDSTVLLCHKSIYMTHKSNTSYTSRSRMRGQTIQDNRIGRRNFVVGSLKKQAENLT
jgi:hypothetical protein